MAIRWIVRRQGGDVGPYTSKQVREALKEGDLDPFDKVCREGSNIFQDLIDVDEIFSDPAPLDHSETVPLEAAAGLEATVAVGVGAPPHDNRSEPKAIEARQEPAAQNPLFVRKYKIVDPTGRRWGPFSAREILAFSAKGTLPATCKVVSKGSKKLVSVREFVSVYTTSKTGKKNSDTLGGLSGISIKQVAEYRLNNMNLGNFKKNPGLLVSAMVFLGAVFGAFTYSLFSGENLRLEQVSKPRKVKKPKLAPSKKVRKPKKVVTSRKKKPGRNQKIKPKISRRSLNRKGGSPFPPPAVKPQRRPNMVAPALVRGQRQQQRVQPGVRKKSLLSSMNGKVVTTEPASFSLAAVRACNTKCRISFRTGRNELFVGVFFKAGFHDVLKRGGRVRVTGRVKVQGKSTFIFIQGMRK